MQNNNMLTWGVKPLKENPVTRNPMQRLTPKHNSEALCPLWSVAIYYMFTYNNGSSACSTTRGVTDMADLAAARPIIGSWRTHTSLPGSTSESMHYSSARLVPRLFPEGEMAWAPLLVHAHYFMWVNVCVRNSESRGHSLLVQRLEIGFDLLTPALML